MCKFIQTNFLFTLLVFAVNTQAQVINIPDTSLKRQLLQASSLNTIAQDDIGNNIKIDVNDDGQIQQSEALLVKRLTVKGESQVVRGYIASLIGIEYFTNLNFFNFSSNRCQTFNLTALTHLDSLECADNAINILNADSLPNLKYLLCSYNSIVTFDARTITNLEFLYIHNNSLTSLYVGNLTNLIGLIFTNNYLHTIDLTGLINLNFLNAGNNLLDSLNINSSTHLLNVFCNKNNLQTFRAIGLELRILDCSNNNISSITLKNLLGLNYLKCDNNKISNLILNSFVYLNELSCSNNKLTSLDITNLVTLQKMNCSNNLLRNIFLKNGRNDTATINTGFIFSGNPYLEYICADESDINILQQKANGYGYAYTIVSSLCNSTLAGANITLKGNVKIDLENNGCTQQDSSYYNLKVKIKNSRDSIYATSDIHGNFAMNLDSGIYTIAPQFSNHYFSVTPTSVSKTLPDTIISSFCIVPDGIHNDVMITIIPIRAARPGFSDATYKIVLKNKGNQIENGTILFKYDESRQSYISATQIPAAVTSGSLTFAFSNLQFFETREIIVTMRTNAPTDNPAVNAGDIIQLSVTANLDNGVHDEFYKDNFQNIRQTVVGSFDPNDKTCLEGEVITPNLVGDYVHYLIRFENTGTANAENIVITDFIDLTKFDISTLEITSTSHSCKTLISNGNKVQFIFDNINLPFTEPLKHGYVAFKIQTKNNLVIGDSLKNHADIYFDYNLPITTNTTTSRIDNITSVKVKANKNGSFSVYPNPSNGYFTINFDSPHEQEINVKIISIKGNIVYEQNLNHNNKSCLQINENLASGIYLVIINGEKEQYIQKLIITK